MVIIGVIFAIAIVVAILAVTLIRRRNKDDDDDVYEQEAGNDERKSNCSNAYICTGKSAACTKDSEGTRKAECKRAGSTKRRQLRINVR